MRRLRYLLAILVGLAGVMLVSGPASASSGDDLTITPSYGCPTETYCSTDFSNEATILAGDSDIITLTLTNLATGSQVAGLMGTTLTGPLPPGSYLLTIEDDFLGHWSCSEYYHDGCIWLDDSDDKYRYKFTYSGSGTLVVPEYVAPSTGFKKIPGKPLAKKTRGKFIVRGRLVATSETATFGLVNASAHRRVVLYRRALHGGRWKRADKTYTRRNGTFRLDGRAPGNSKYRWYVWIPKRGTSPAFVGQTVRARQVL
jgi:hypothetical protein